MQQPTEVICKDASEGIGSKPLSFNRAVEFLARRWSKWLNQGRIGPVQPGLKFIGQLGAG
jgi:hypothetical protein